MMKKRVLQLVAALFVLCVPCVLGGLATDTDALINGTDVWSGSSTFGQMGSGFYGWIEYAVYKVDVYNTEYPAYDIVDDDIHYVYAYQLYNSDESEVGIDMFSVGILPGSPLVDYLSFNPMLGDIGGVSPNLQSVFGQSVLYAFSNGIGGDGSQEQSVSLVFASGDGPGLADGGVSAGYFGNVLIEDLPTPDPLFVEQPEVPEPATVSLLGLGICAILKRKK